MGGELLLVLSLWTHRRQASSIFGRSVKISHGGTGLSLSATVLSNQASIAPPRGLLLAHLEVKISPTCTNRNPRADRDHSRVAMGGFPVTDMGSNGLA